MWSSESWKEQAAWALEACAEDAASEGIVCQALAKTIAFAKKYRVNSDAGWIKVLIIKFSQLFEPSYEPMSLDVQQQTFLFFFQKADK